MASYRIPTSARKPAVRLTREANRDFEDILLYTRGTWGSRQTATYRAAITRAFRRLRDHPRSGEPRDDLFLGCRILPVEQHIIYYHTAQPTEVVVLRNRHHRQDASVAVKPPIP